MNGRGNRAARRLLLALLLILALGGCGKKKAQLQPTALPADASFERASRLLAKHDLRQATAVLKRMQFSPGSRDELEPLHRLALADATYYRGTALDWIDARNLYIDFATLNSEHPLAPYAQLQVGQCSLKQINAPTKDQSATRQAIQDLQAIERRWPDSDYAIAARSLMREARSNLAESELQIGRYYLKKDHFAAAIGRLRGIVVRFPEFARLDEALYFLAVAYDRDDNERQAGIYVERLLSDYPNGAFVGRARKLLGSLEPRFDAELDSAP